MKNALFLTVLWLCLAISSEGLAKVEDDAVIFQFTSTEAMKAASKAIVANPSYLRRECAYRWDGSQFIPVGAAENPDVVFTFQQKSRRPVIWSFRMFFGMLTAGTCTAASRWLVTERNVSDEKVALRVALTGVVAYWMNREIWKIRTRWVEVRMHVHGIDTTPVRKYHYTPPPVIPSF